MGSILKRMHWPVVDWLIKGGTKVEMGRGDSHSHLIDITPCPSGHDTFHDIFPSVIFLQVLTVSFVWILCIFDFSIPSGFLCDMHFCVQNSASVSFFSVLLLGLSQWKADRTNCCSSVNLVIVFGGKAAASNGRFISICLILWFIY